MLFNWLRKRRRKRILKTPFPDTWEPVIAENVPQVQKLSESQRSRLRQLVQIFVAEKNWEGCNGLSVTEEMKVTIAALACLLVVEMKDVHFDNVLSILIYPTSYIATDTQITRAGVVIEGGQARSGEAWWRGPVVLSWRDTLAGCRSPASGHNLVLHEFAHQLDMMNGRIIDGTPVLSSGQQHDRWVQVLGSEFERHVRRCRHGIQDVIDCYGATNPAEFFAVLTEAFFEKPVALQYHHADVYAVLRDFYRLDPVEWFA